VYWKRLLALVLGLSQKNNRDYALKLAVAFLVTAVLGLLVKKLGFQLPETIAPVAWALLVGGVVMLGAEALDARRTHVAEDSPQAISWGVAVLVGVAQVVAGVFPGTSRSAAAIFSALLFGRGGRGAATEFAFLVGIPTMFAATGYELLHTLKDGGAANEDWTALGVAFVVSALVAFAAVKWLLRYIQTHRFTVFAWYRIALGAALLGWLYLGSAPPVQATAALGSVATPAQAQSAATMTPAAPAPAAVRAANLPLGAVASAASGTDADEAARAQDIARFRAAKLCVQAAMIRPQLHGATLETFVVPPDNPNFSAADRQAQLSETKAMFDLLDRADVECPHESAQVLDGSIYDLALRAADAGDLQAASCYAWGAFPIPPKVWDRPEFQARFRENVDRLVEQGVRSGSWPLAIIGMGRNNPRRHSWRHVPLTSTSELGYMAVMSAFETGDAGRAYGFAWLRKLGAKGEFTDEAFLDNLGKQLSERQRIDSISWAEQTWARNFKGGRYDQRNLQTCPLG
jgi:undecaprenyl-diphosphatase